MRGTLKSRTSEKGFGVFKPWKKGCHQLLLVSWRNLKTLDFRGRKWRLEPASAAARVALAGKEETGA